MIKRISAQESDSNSQVLSRYLLWVFLIVNLGSLIYYQFTNIRSDFYHEAAYPYLYATSDLETNSLFTSRFSGREIAPISWPLINHLLMALGLEPTFLMVGISNVMFILFSILVIIWFGRNFALNRTQILLTLVLFTTIFGVRPFRYSWMDQVWIWPMHSYGIYELLSLILCVLAFKMITKHHPGLTLFQGVLKNRYFLVVFFIFGLNHTRGLLQIYGPVGFALLVLYILHLEKQNRESSRVYLQVFISTLFATLLGRFLIGVLTSGVPQYWQQPSQNFTTLDQNNFAYRLLSPVFTLFQLFGINPTEGQPVISAHGLRILSVFALVVVIVFSPIVMYLQGKNFNQTNLGGKFMFLHLFYFVLVSFFTALFTNSAGVVRYSIPLAISAIFFVPFVFSENRFKQILFTFLVISLLSPNIVSGAKRLNEPISVDYRQNSNYKLTQSLLENDLDYGFAGPWTEDVLVIPFYSNNKIHISLIDIEPFGPHLHADKSWFLEADHKGKTFVAIPTSLIPGNEKFLMLANVAKSAYTVDKWTVLIFQENPVKLIGQLQ